ncbi:hypothetical protein DPMN_156791 [Dreissena polymorpha]|uniref:Uncharacterized protein n=1 Tax=Dreissena polymorpha TaxID=45954 RepID=A0A9D4J7W2_DREPO|nr:hypothetical protein DPMN_156791 [Dreissena polymorpha]
MRPELLQTRLGICIVWQGVTLSVNGTMKPCLTLCTAELLTRMQDCAGWSGDKSHMA